RRRHRTAAVPASRFGGSGGGGGRWRRRRQRAAGTAARAQAACEQRAGRGGRGRGPGLHGQSEEVCYPAFQFAACGGGSGGAEGRWGERGDAESEEYGVL
ncbi:hypothetical protein LTR66_009627, partial [Elasticomyces elasticus]